MATLKSGSKAEENADLFSELPEDILVSIMSFFTIKEAAKFSLVSRKCEVTWRYFPVLIFEDYQAKEKIWDSWDSVLEEKACFVERVDRVIEKQLGTTIDELRITFDLERNSQSYVDKWVAFALDKQVKRLELNFTTIERKLHVYDCRMYQACCICLDLSPRLLTHFFKSVLTSLCLRYVNVTDEFVDYLPLSCPLLETLCIEGSRYLTRVTGSLHVKQFEASYCVKLRKIDVSAPKLQSLTLNSKFPIELHIVDAPLFKMSIGGDETLPHAFDNLSNILSQLVYLNLMFDLPLMRDLMNGVAMPKLQHLELTVEHALMDSCLLHKCRFVIDASPNLQKLTLKLENLKTRKFFDEEVHAWVGCWSSLKCLKTLEIVGYWGTITDLELAFFVLENASMLEEIIVDFVPLDNNDKRERLVLLERRLPQGVKLTVK